MVAVIKILKGMCDFNDMPTCQGCNAERLGNLIHCPFTFFGQSLKFLAHSPIKYK